jgi:hypothetical protein
VNRRGVDGRAVSVGRLLHTMGQSPQRPLYRASQQNPEAVQRWRGEQFPAIRKQAKAEGATVYFVLSVALNEDVRVVAAAGVEDG